jgi:hypothetical protein
VGGAIGAGVVLFLREYLSTLVPWWQYVLGGVYVLAILYLPGGLMSIPARIRQRRALAPAPRLAKNNWCPRRSERRMRPRDRSDAKRSGEP